MGFPVYAPRASSNTVALGLLEAADENPDHPNIFQRPLARQSSSVGGVPPSAQA